MTQAQKQEHSSLQQGDVCPQCGQPLVFRHSSRGDFLGCSDYPHCSFIQPVASSHRISILKPLNVSCPQCGAQLAVKKGRFGLFIGCLNYPTCDFVQRTNAITEIGCPICRQGQLREQISKSGTSFYSCSNYPHCTYSVPGKPVQTVCPSCSFALMYERLTKKGTSLVCGNSLCPSIKHRQRRSRPRIAD